MRILSYRLTFATAMGLVAFSGASVVAVSSNANAHAERTTIDASASPPSGGKPSDAVSQGASHLAAVQLKSCQKLEGAVNNIMARIVDRGSKQIVVFDTIATRTEAFYASKGKAVAKYDGLVAAVTAAKAKALLDLAALKTTTL